MVIEARQSNAKLKSLFLVRVTMPSGTFSVGYGAPEEALKAVANFHQSGLRCVGIYDADGRKLDLAEVQDAARPPSEPARR